MCMEFCVDIEISSASLQFMFFFGFVFAEVQSFAPDILDKNDPKLVKKLGLAEGVPKMRMTIQGFTQD